MKNGSFVLLSVFVLVGCNESSDTTSIPESEVVEFSKFNEQGCLKLPSTGIVSQPPILTIILDKPDFLISYGADPNNREIQNHSWKWHQDDLILEYIGAVPDRDGTHRVFYDSTQHLLDEFSVLGAVKHQGANGRLYTHLYGNYHFENSFLPDGKLNKVSYQHFDTGIHEETREIEVLAYDINDRPLTIATTVVLEHPTNGGDEYFQSDIDYDDIHNIILKKSYKIEATEIYEYKYTDYFQLTEFTLWENSIESEPVFHAYMPEQPTYGNFDTICAN